MLQTSAPSAKCRSTPAKTDAAEALSLEGRDRLGGRAGDDCRMRYVVGSVFVPQTDAASDAPDNEELMASSGETPARMRQTSARWARCLSILAKTGR